MKELLSIVRVAMLTVCSAAAATPQTSSAGQARTGKKVDVDTVTVTGCVAAGAAAGQYTLTHSAILPALIDREKPATTRDTMSAGHGMSYTLIGGTDLKAHLGHKIEVTGIVEKMEQKDKRADEKTTTDKSATEMMGGSLTVKSVRMLSVTCP